MNFICTEELINTVKDTIPFFFESNMMDEASLYHEIDKCLSSLGPEALPIKNVTVAVENYKAILPEDFFSAKILLSCQASTTVKLPQTTGIHSYEQRVCEVPACHHQCEYSYDEKGLYQIYKKLDDVYYEMRNLQYVTLAAKSKACTECLNPRTKDKYEAEICGEFGSYTLETQFESGSVFIEYRSKSDLFIPDYPEILDWMESHLITFTFKKLWYNMDEGVFQRFQASQQETEFKKHTARAFWRRREFSEFRDLKSWITSRNRSLAFDPSQYRGTSLPYRTV